MKTKLVKAGNGRMVAQKVPFSTDEAFTELLQSRRKDEESADAKLGEASKQRLQMALVWIENNQKDLILGLVADAAFINQNSAQTSLAEFEETYRCEAVLLHDANFGQIWLSKSLENIEQRRTIVYALCTKECGNKIEYEIRYIW